MAALWILVASRAKARIFSSRGNLRFLTALRAFANPAGRLKSRDLESDKPGRAFESARGGIFKHSYGKRESAHDRMSRNFARRLAGHLDRARKAGRFEALVLVAEPDFLGLLRGALPSKCRASVAASLPKDLVGLGERELGPELEGFLGVPYRRVA